MKVPTRGIQLESKVKLVGKHCYTLHGPISISIGTLRLASYSLKHFTLFLFHAISIVQWHIGQMFGL